MRVGISLLTLVPGEMGGTETYVRGLTGALVEVGTLDYTVFAPPAARGAGGGLPEVVVDEYGTVRTRGGRIVALARAAMRPRPLARHFADVDVVHHALTVAVPRLDAPRVVTLFDLQHVDLPHLFSRAERAYRRVAYDASARGADALIVTSQFVRRSVVSQLGVAPERVHSIPLGLDHDRFRPGDEQREAFLLYPARPWPHKNHQRLYEAFARLRRERPELRLVLTGGGHDERAVPAGVEVRGLVAVEELVSLYRRAACLVFPSLYEGFGQPPLEAMACGCPVAASNIPAIAEACGDAAALFDPEQPEDIAAVVAGVLDAPERFSAAGLERARAFTWHDTARRHEAVYGAIV